MENLDLNEILNRKNEEHTMMSLLQQFDNNKEDISIKRNIYIYGSSGIGKTTFVVNILKKMNYDIVKYDASDIRNKSVIENIAHHNMSDKNIISMFRNKVKNIAVVMDEIDGMNNGDKGGINSLIKIIRPKKTKKQKLEEQTRNPIICIGNYHIDKKINELMKVCNIIELKPPTTEQINTLITLLLPNIRDSLKESMCDFIQRDLTKFVNVYDIYNNTSELLRDDLFHNIFRKKSFNENTKQITQHLFLKPNSIFEHNNVINDTDRTIVGLLWHENVINHIQKEPNNISIPFYLKILNNICFSDYIDRITFQKQIWQFNEMTSLIKTFYNNKLYHEHINMNPKYVNMKLLENTNNIRFTKVLTKYSTEYNNNNFIQNMCQCLNIERKDLFSLFFYIRDKYKDHEIYSFFEDTDITKLDINRLCRFLDKYIYENATGLTEVFIQEDKMSEDDIVDEAI